MVGWVVWRPWIEELPKKSDPALRKQSFAESEMFPQRERPECGYDEISRLFEMPVKQERKLTSAAADVLLAPSLDQ